MDASKFISVLSFTLVIALAFSEANAQQWQQWCKRTSNPRLCQSIVQADSRAGLKTSLVGIGTIVKDKAVSTAVSTNNKISSLIRTTPNKQVVDNLKWCSQVYSRSIPQLKSADLFHFNYLKLVEALTYGKDGPKECKVLFQEPGVGRSPVEGEVQSLIDICSIVTEIVNLRQCNSNYSC